MGNLKCGISQKQLIVEQNGRTFGTRGTTVYFWCLVPCHSGHFAKFQIALFSKHNSFNSFHQISTKLHTNYHNQGLLNIVYYRWFFGWSLKFLLTQGLIWGWKFQNATPPTVFIWCQPHFMKTLSYHGGRQAITFLGNLPSFYFFLWHFETLW